ncbi:nuclear transport factor 2 family protein [Actinomadura rubrisoli]|uniref:Nuclear transport factor 2 family protein n=1 Tax=Actinomadura rubrisoli TaxID=2530368 RepID=A0A4R5CGC8_9ACTN|nr:nuclear transport factor 2 family protein [Actinomadura rubrisoli]TDD96314.1 nuclear transport factor 2 family protein [Actinomadura rubrisoli]
MGTQTSRTVVDSFFTSLERGDLDSAFSTLSEDIEFELPLNQWNAVIPYLGRHVGIAEVSRAFAVRAETTEVLDYALRDLRAEGDTAFAVIYTRARCSATGQEFEVEDVHRLTVTDGKIADWKVYFDPNSEVAAFTAERDRE